MIEGNVLITGGSGFLGRAILRRAQREKWPARFTIYSRDETKQWELKHRYPGTVCILGDVSRDLDRLVAVMAGQDVVIHAAAVKYIPEAEFNVSETIDVNVNGSRNVAIAARAANVGVVVGVSTDKASAPLNTYGMTKALMERYFAEANRMGGTRFATVRYGNVVGSTGSVIPVFRQQLVEYGEVRVTDKRMTRFWLGVDQAIDLILFAIKAAPACPGYTIIDACPAMSIDNLAKAVWAEQRPDKTPVITYTGIRPGEKLHEALYNEQEAPRMVRNDRYFLLKPATDHYQTGTTTGGYTSDRPRLWLDVPAMLALMRDAAGV